MAALATLWVASASAALPGQQEARADAIRVTVVTPDVSTEKARRKGEPNQGSIVATMLTGPGNREASAPPPIRTEVGIPGSADLRLPTGHRWRIRVDSGAYWANAEIVEATDRPQVLRLPAFQTAMVGGRLAGLDDAEGDVLRARFLRRASRVANKGVLGTNSCTVGEDHRFECQVPAGSVDLRLETLDRFHDVLWNLDLSAGKYRDLGLIRLRRGGRLAGTVVDGIESAPVDGAAVRLVPSTLAELHLVERQRFLLAGTSSQTDSGRFELSSVPPGVYDLIIEKAGWTPARRKEIRIREGTATVLPGPLVLQQPATLELFLSPPVSPSGEVWRVQMLQHRPSGGVELIDSPIPEVDPGGSWLANGLEPGSYRVHVGTERSPRWFEDEVALEPGLNTVQLEIGGLPVHGRLSAGNEPVEGVIWFGGRSGETSVRVATDQQGRFEGHLPREGEWPVEISCHGSEGVQRLAPVEVRRRPDGEPALVEIELPGTILRGRVVDAADRPVPDAVVEILNPTERRLEATTYSDSQGEFELVGLEPGIVQVEASSGGQRSQTERARLDEDQSSPSLRLVLASEKVLEGVVLGSSLPVPGARVLGVPSVTTPAPVPVVSVVTGADGRFTAKVPADTVGLRVLVQAAGFGLRPMTLTVLPEHGDLRLDMTPEGGVLEILSTGNSSLDRARLDFEGTSFPVTFYRQLGGSAAGGVITGDDHKLVLANMPPGNYTLCTWEGSESACTSAYLAPDAIVTLVAEDEEGE